MGYNRYYTMKKIFILMLPLFLLCSCATYNLSKSVWYNLSFVEKDGQKADITTSLHFISDSQVDVFTSVVSDSAFIVKPFKYAEGTYSISGNPKKQAQVKIDAKTIDKKDLNLVGAYRKNDGMILMNQDSIIKVYSKLPNVEL